MQELNNNQIIFCQEYVDNGLNGTQAYLKAYKTCKSEDTAKVNASRLLTKANIQEYIRELQGKLEDKAIMSAKERMKWLTEVINDVQTEGVKIKTIDKDFIIGEGTADLSTKMKAIDILNRMEGNYTTKFSGDVNLSYEKVLKEMTDKDEY